MDILLLYILIQKVKTFYSHPIIRWIVRAIRQKEPSQALFVLYEKNALLP